MAEYLEASDETYILYPTSYIPQPIFHIPYHHIMLHSLSMMPIRLPIGVSTKVSKGVPMRVSMGDAYGGGL